MPKCLDSSWNDESSRGTFGSAVARHSFGILGAALWFVVGDGEKKVAPRQLESSVEPEHSQRVLPKLLDIEVVANFHMVGLEAVDRGDLSARGCAFKPGGRAPAVLIGDLHQTVMHRVLMHIA